MQPTRKERGKRGISSHEDLACLEKNDLIEKIIKLETRNVQLQQILKRVHEDDSAKTAKNKKQKVFDFTKYPKRHVLLKFYYLGWNHDGFVVQEDTSNTVEAHLFSALMKSCFIENRENSNYHRCGRTDKGVSAFSQVISLDVRSCLQPEEQHNFERELKYCKILNRLLPRSIRCIAWSPVPQEISARFDCRSRTYKYFFPKGNLNVEQMNKAAGYLIGTHDFRNFCKMDVGNGVVNFQRTIDNAEVRCDKDNGASGYDMCVLTITSQAFLWHQIRCIMGLLVLVGQQQEKPEIISDLLDITKCPRKPQYNMASELPLSLVNCDYENVNWQMDEENLRSVIKDLQEDWATNSSKTSMIKTLLDTLSQDLQDTEYQAEFLLQGTRSKTYQALMQRVTCESLENRIEHYTKKLCRKQDAQN